MPVAVPNGVFERAESLKKSLGENTSLAAMRALQVELSRLRDLFRRQRHLFDASTVSLLKELSLRAKTRSEAGLGEAHDLALGALSQTFGYQVFRPGQEAVITSLLSGRDTIGVMPTGAGKSLTYQIPARVLGGTSLVVSPLIALMKDQVDALCEVGIRATYLNSTLPSDERLARLRGLSEGKYELLYAAPEGLEASVGNILGTLDLRFIAVDEAHCISQWGHDFRPAYRKLHGLKQRFHVPILALTATATARVMEDIHSQLSMHDPVVFRGSFFRPNLRLSAYAKGEALGTTVQKAILRLVRARAGQSGIIYCLSRKRTEELARYLRENGAKVEAYHAGLNPEERARVQDNFRNDAIDVVTATIAFGMGIDKPNVRYVVHADMPRSIEGYYQEIGRAGRDGLSSDCILFFSWSEVRTYDRFAEELEDEQASDRLRKQAREMFALAESEGCRHQGLVGYFGENSARCEASCDRCQGLDVLGETKPVSLYRQGPVERTRGLSARTNQVDAVLFDRLRAHRRELAEERGVPAYVVFSDSTLLEMAAESPRSLGELGGISGVGPTKLSRYGASFLKVIEAHHNAP